MDLKYKIRTYNFWISLSASVLVVLRLLGESFGFSIDSSLFMDIATAVCGVLVVLGIIIMPASSTNKSSNKVNKIADNEKTEEDEDEKPLDLAEQTSNVNECQENLIDLAEKQTEIENCFEETTQKDGCDDAEEKSLEEDAQLAIRAAIEELSKNPEELYSIVKEMLNNK